ERGPRGDAPATERGYTSYKIGVGHTHGARPPGIVGALTGEGGLHGKDIGKIQIFPNFALVQIRGALPPEQMERISRAKVGGRAAARARAGTGTGRSAAMTAAGASTGSVARSVATRAERPARVRAAPPSPDPGGGGAARGGGGLCAQPSSGQVSPASASPAPRRTPCGPRPCPGS